MLDLGNIPYILVDLVLRIAALYYLHAFDIYSHHVTTCENHTWC